MNILKQIETVNSESKHKRGVYMFDVHTFAYVFIENHPLQTTDYSSLRTEKQKSK